MYQNLAFPGIKFQNFLTPPRPYVYGERTLPPHTPSWRTTSAEPWTRISSMAFHICT